MAFKFYIDGFLTDQPDNGTDLVTTIKRDSELGGFLTTQDVTLIYSGNNAPEIGEISGYTYLKNMFDSGTCNEAELVIYDEISATETYRVYTGVIKVPAIMIEEQLVRLSTKIDDNNFYSYIKNNRNVKFSLYATKTKNGEAITPPDVYRCDFFNSANGVFLSAVGALYQGYRIYDVLKFLVPAISDNKVTFESDYLSSPDTQLFIFDGSALVNPNSNPAVVVSFQEIISELFKLKNLSFYIDQTDPDAPVLRLEDSQWFYIGTNVLTFDEPLEIKTSVKSTKIPGTINVGSEYNPGGQNALYTFNAGTSYFGWKREVYTPFGQCNTDIELDLVNQFIIASNAINDQIGGVTESNLDSMFIVEMDNVDTTLFTADAVDYEIFGNGAKRFYNVGLNNVNKIGLHGGNFQSAISNTQDPGNGICHVSLGSDTTILDQTPGSGAVSTFSTPNIELPIIFADEFGGSNYDPGSNWNNVSGEYVAQQDGDHSFTASYEVTSANIKTCITPNNLSTAALNIPTQYGVDLTVFIIAYSDATLTTLVGTASVTTRITSNITATYSVALPIALPTGAVVKSGTSAQLIVLFPTIFGNTPLSQAVINGGLCGYTALEPKILLSALSESYFECNGTPDGALVLAEPDLALYKIKLHEFEYDLTATEFRTIQALPIGSFEFIKDGASRSGWIEQLTHNNWTGRTQIKLISQDATS
jgi:hypothetical protein